MVGWLIGDELLVCWKEDVWEGNWVHGARVASLGYYCSYSTRSWFNQWDSYDNKQFLV